jgi:hypothetical protein
VDRLTDVVSGPMVVVWPKGGWHVSDAYIVAWIERSYQVKLESRVGATSMKVNVK